MRILTRQEIQALSDNELNNKLSRFQTEPFCLYPSYCYSLDAQFELAQKFDEFQYSVGWSAADVDCDYNPYMFFVRNLHNKYTIERAGKNKRTGAELLLEAIQELEKNK